MSGCTLEVDPGLFYPPLMMAQRDLNIFPLYGQEKLTGAVTGPLFPSNAAELLVAAIGTDVVTGSVAPYTHTISQANQLASLTVEKNLGNYQSLQFAGGRVSKFSLKCPNSDAPADITADLETQSWAILATPTAVTIANELPFVFAEAQLTVFGTVVTQVTNIQLDIDNAVKGTYTFAQSHQPSFLTPVTRKVTGTFDVAFDSLNDATYGYFSMMMAQTQGSLSFKLAHPTAPGYSVTFTLPQINLSKYADDVKMEDIVISSIQFEASLDLATGVTVQAVINNGVATGY